MAGARRAAESGNDGGGLLAVRLPAREDTETRDGIGAGPDGSAQEPQGTGVAGTVEVDGSVPFWRWDLVGLSLTEVDMVGARPGSRAATG